MLDYELKKRDKELMKQMRDLIINFIDRYKVKPHNAELFRKLSVKTEIRFNELIKNLTLEIIKNNIFLTSCEYSIPLNS